MLYLKNLMSAGFKTGSALFAVLCFSTNAQATAPAARIKLSISADKDSALRLETIAAPLEQILNEISRKTGAVIHYSVLPEAPVTATCAGADVAQLMDCLAAKQIGLVGHKAQKDRPAEFWLLGSSVGSCQAVTVSSKQNVLIKVEQNLSSEQQSEINQNQTNTLLEKFKNAKDTGERAETLNNLSSIGKIDNPDVRDTLEEGMNDKDASIRAQVIDTLSYLDKDNSTGYLDRALTDKSSEVRITALSKAVNHKEILERALSDQDVRVSEYAASLLEQINKQSQR